MSTAALVLISVVWSGVTFATGYFFWLVLKTPAKPEVDSYTDNDVIDK